ncbi:D-alanyl-D-alanine carboxypeptidase family protein [Roseibium sp. RKSG952]|uniref:D-alanyl-D-alanine carboxypeptidase family protein n=1 Tax=Roseibium sp. RKSG952 TaxID=2529384 RepID=UPI0012BD33D0|nr:D-alanyl-D-alanine carboxypeptidase family protein [Roseibium sp. RKSG952]MTH95944.1 D-alanyl-D-alanine carboxypeptidase [Roseibium sp. RKSG952]
MMLPEVCRQVVKRLAPFVIALSVSCSVGAQSLSLAAKSAILIEPFSGTTLYAKAEDEPFAPGSLAKVMTAAVVFDALQQGEIAGEDTCRVSEHAWRTGGAPARGATMFAELKSEISIDDLLKGLLVHNANDAAIVLAECLAGTEAGFAARMTGFGQTIGMQNSVFRNPTGYEAAGAKTTASDMARLGAYIVTEQGNRYPVFSQPEFTWNRIFQRNKNPLLGEIRGLDGLGAGQSETDGFAGLASLERNGRRVVGVVSGLPSDKARLKAMRDLVDGAWDFFTVQRIFDKGEPVAAAAVFGGTSGKVPLVAKQDVDVLLPRGGTLDYRLRVVYDGPLNAPVAAGQPAGELRVIGEDGVVYSTELETGDDIPTGPLHARAADGLVELLFGWF